MNKSLRSSFKFINLRLILFQKPLPAPYLSYLFVIFESLIDSMTDLCVFLLITARFRPGGWKAAAIFHKEIWK